MHLSSTRVDHYQRTLVPVFGAELGLEQAGERRLYTVADPYAATEVAPILS